MSFYNTTSETNPELNGYRHKADTQDDLVYEWYKIFGQGSPSAVHATILQNSPITSIRRSINTLTNQGRLEKTSHRVKGQYSRNEFVWKLRGQANQGDLFDV